MKVKLEIFIGVIAILLLVLVGVLFSKNEQIASPQSKMTEYSNPDLPNIGGPLPNGEKVSLEQARASISYTIPLPKAMKIKEAWISTNAENALDQSTAIKFEGDLLLIIHKMENSPDWDGIISSTPELMKISINGIPGVGTSPGFTQYDNRKYPYPGSVGWWIDGLSITLYSGTMSLEELLKIAETVSSAP
jgi:hypothetical protein